MRKFTVILVLSFILIVVLFVLAFFYVDFSGHTGFLFNIYSSDKIAGTIRIDRFVTEDKVIYKSHTEYFNSLEYPIVDERMYLKRKTMTPQKFMEETKGTKGRKRLIWLFQDGEVTDILFLEYPRIFSLEGFETGRKTMVFSPYSAMLYMPIVDKYNFWKKGAQFFEVMIPVREPVPPMRDKIRMKYSHDAYVSIGGSKIEAEVFVVGGKGIPETYLVLAKYSHEILEIEVKGTKTKIILTSYLESPNKRIRFIVDKIIKFFEEAAKKEKSVKEKLLFDEKDEADAPTLPEKKEITINIKDIFFESGNLTLSGKIWTSGEEETFPAVIFVPANTPSTQGEEALINSVGNSLSRSGFIVFTFDAPGQGRSQGNAAEVDDETISKHIKSAISYLEEYPGVEKGNISLIGYEGGGYLALKASSENPSVLTCIVLGIPPGSAGIDLSKEPSREDIEKMLSLHGLGPFEDTFTDLVAEKIGQYQEEILTSEDKYSFFRGMRLPIKGYKDFLRRKPYEMISDYKKPLLLIYGRDDKRFDAKASERIKRLNKKKDSDVKISEIRSSGKYMSGKTAESGIEGFAVDSDIIDLITSWIKEKGIAKGGD